MKTTLIENDSEDIFKNPQLAMNQVVKAEDYTYFKFCIPYHCATMNVVLENCIDSTACPLTYSWPELLVSRRLPNPTVNDKRFAIIKQKYLNVYAFWLKPSTSYLYIKPFTYLMCIVFVCS